MVLALLAAAEVEGKYSDGRKKKKGHREHADSMAEDVSLAIQLTLGYIVGLR